MIFVTIPSTVPPIKPPIRGTALPRLTTPFSPNLVTSLKPTALFIDLIISPGIFLIAW